MARGQELATERIITLMTPSEKSALETRASKAGVSIGEFVRRSVDCYDAEEASALAQLAVLAAELQRSNLEASAALDQALASVAATRAQLEGGTSRISVFNCTDPYNKLPGRRF